MNARFSPALLCLALSSSALAAEHTVTQKGRNFSVVDLVITPGDVVRFVNDDDTSHNVFSSSAGQDFNLGIQKAGDSSSRTFQKAGVVEVRCAIHPSMKLKITVK